MKRTICGICKRALKKGDRVFHDPTKSEANSLAHEKCWIKLSIERRTRPDRTVVKKVKAEVKSSVPLDPAF